MRHQLHHVPGRILLHGPVHNNYPVLCTGDCSVYCAAGSNQTGTCPVDSICPTPATIQPIVGGLYYPLPHPACYSLTCPAGYYCPFGTTAPVLAGCGNYSNSTGLANAVACDLGTLCPNEYNPYNPVPAPDAFNDVPCPANQPTWSALVTTSAILSPTSISASCNGTVLLVGKANDTFWNHAYAGGKSDMMAAAFNESTGLVLSTDEVGGSAADAWNGVAYNPQSGAFEVIGYSSSSTVGGIATAGIPSYVWAQYNATGGRVQSTLVSYSCASGTLRIHSAAHTNAAAGGGLVSAGDTTCYYITQTSLLNSTWMLLVTGPTGAPVLQISNFLVLISVFNTTTNASMAVTQLQVGPPGSSFEYVVDANGTIVATGYPRGSVNGTQYGWNGTLVAAFSYHGYLLWQVPLDITNGVVGALAGFGDRVFVSGQSLSGQYAGFTCFITGCTVVLVLNTTNGAGIGHYEHFDTQRMFTTYISAAVFQQQTFAALRGVNEANYVIDIYSEDAVWNGPTLYGVNQQPVAITA